MFYTIRSAYISMALHLDHCVVRSEACIESCGAAPQGKALAVCVRCNDGRICHSFLGVCAVKMQCCFMCSAVTYDQFCTHVMGCGAVYRRLFSGTELHPSLLKAEGLVWPSDLLQRVQPGLVLVGASSPRPLWTCLEVSAQLSMF